ncbi:MAG: succinate--CoA ligase subunit alpha [Alphaproteobacteria bacterium]|nr:succinate--CoA ligase subunit alpha [Alphaproteobacteria bacterium]
MAILANKNTRVLVQGITGMQATFHTKRSIEGGTKIIAGVSPKHGGETHLDVPVFNTVADAVREMQVDASVLFVPAMAVKSAVREAVEAQIKLIVSIAQGVPVHDMLEIRAMLKSSNTLMIGPNTPGVITPQEARLGIFPENIHHKGCIGVVSRSSTLTYEAVLETNRAGFGQSTVVGLGDDMIIGSDFTDMLSRFMDDDETKAIVMLGKADNSYEQMAAAYYKGLARKKPVIAFIAGASLPFGYNMGYAFDIITHGHVTVNDKKEIMKDAGIIVVDRMSQIHEVLQSLSL